MKKFTLLAAAAAVVAAVSAPAAMASYDFVPFSRSVPPDSAAGGFAWGDAALGAAAALAVVAVGAAVLLIGRRNRELRSSTQVS